MPKAYLVTTYRSITDADKLAAYAKLAAPAIAAAGGRFLVRGTPARVMENGVKERTVVVEFGTLAAALGFYEDPAYQAAMQALDGGADRDMRIVEGLD